MYILKSKIRAFGLIEVLISVVILSIGLLGLASLQNRSMQTLQESDNLATASMIAREMANRMISNRYILSQGRLGYLNTDLNNDISSSGGVQNWIDETMTTNPEIARCYSSDQTESCFADNANLNNSADHITALANMQLMDEVEIRQLASDSLPDGEIKICFDTSGSSTNWDCDNVATRVSERKENVFTVKVRWTNIFSNSSQIYVLQFTAECTDNSSTFCG